VRPAFLSREHPRPFAGVKLFLGENARRSSERSPTLAEARIENEMERPHEEVANSMRIADSHASAARKQIKFLRRRNFLRDIRVAR
jgi:hypothetical protein